MEVLGPWLHNKGDELNIWACAERLGRTFDVGVSSTLGLDEHPAEPPLLRVRWPSTGPELGAAVRRGAVRGLAGMLRRDAIVGLLPADRLRSRGIVAGRDVRALVDCSGYAYGDGWSTRRAEARERYFRRLKRHGATIVLLPQALGPFREPAVRERVAALFETVDLIFARDRVSLAHVHELGVPPGKVDVAPDVTHLLAGIPPERPADWARRVCVVPNARMLDKVDAATSARYVGFMLTCLREVRANDLEPVLLLHEANDRALAEELRGALDFPVEIVDVDARRAKGMLGASYALVGSRYHAIISALSQGTPVVGTSWSHKYEELFGDYDTTEHLVSPAMDDAALRAHLRGFLAADAQAGLRARLRERAAVQKAAVSAMWDRVERLILGAGAAPAARVG